MHIKLARDNKIENVGTKWVFEQNCDFQKNIDFLLAVASDRLFWFKRGRASRRRALR